MSKLQVDFTGLNDAVDNAILAEFSKWEAPHGERNTVAAMVRDYKRKVAEEFAKLPEWLTKAKVTTDLGDELTIDKDPNRVMLVDQQGVVLYKQEF